MIESAETALEFVSGRQRADLDTDRMLLFALVRAIEVVGEAAGRISEAARAAALAREGAETPQPSQLELPAN
ncbi:MAG TPA: HepT-like ribonuclease domain-containing protein [Thermoanaerobaculia bacterium]